MNPKRISVDEALSEVGMTMEDCVVESVVPACCEDGCEVEPDGRCEHGHPSVLIEAGLI